MAQAEQLWPAQLEATEQTPDLSAPTDLSTNLAGRPDPAGSSVGRVDRTPAAGSPSGSDGFLIRHPTIPELARGGGSGTRGLGMSRACPPLTQGTTDVKSRRRLRARKGVPGVRCFMAPLV